MKYPRVVVSIFCLAIASAAAAYSDSMDRQRSDFLLAEKLIAQGNDDAFFNIGLTLVDYPLYPYLQYQWLKNHYEQSGKILAFLHAYKDTRYAELLRSKWLTYLAEQKRWPEFIQHYQANGNTALECRFHWANYNIGNKQQALNEAKRLWAVGASQPQECNPLFSALAMSPLLTSDLIWQRFELALKEDNVHLANYLGRLLDKSEQGLAGLWLKVHEKPVSIQQGWFWSGSDKRLGLVFAHGIEWMAKDNLDLAVMIWDANKLNPALNSQTVERVERRLALALAQSRKPGAYDRLIRLLGFDKEVREWKVRAALYEQDWRHIADALATLTLEELKEPRWQYWQARSVAAKGDTANARDLYAKLSLDRGFYGFLAADAVAKPYSVPDKPVFLAINELEALTAEADFQTVKELRNLNRDMEAERQWWYAVKKLSKERMAIAAKLAQYWHWDQVAIKTLVKADYWDDLALRFPVGYLNQVQSNAYRQNLDPAIVLGLIRQESMLDARAQSAVGALGLMQIMPKTGRQIAQEINERWQSENSLFDPDVNIKYGAYYYKSLLDKFNGHVALATAAYNAGPSRVAKWLPFGRSMPADIWVETIPYKETRKYVTSVLSYVIIYQHRIQRGTLKMKDFMRDILPG
jgi:soluble lytic murein transglycosylase